MLPTPGWAGGYMSKMPIITQNSQPIGNYAADNDLPSASTAGLILLTNMPDGANWWKVNWSMELQLILPQNSPQISSDSQFPECETVVVSIMMHYKCRVSQENPFLRFTLKDGEFWDSCTWYSHLCILHLICRFTWCACRIYFHERFNMCFSQTWWQTHETKENLVVSKNQIGLMQYCKGKEPGSPKASPEESTRVKPKQSADTTRRGSEGNDLLIPEPNCSACLVLPSLMGPLKGEQTKLCVTCCALSNLTVTQQYRISSFHIYEHA